MAGARPSSFKKSGGGFLKDVDGTITGYTLTDSAFGEAKTSAKNADFTTMHSVLSFRPDGAEADVTTKLFAGNAQAFNISDDGHTLEAVNEGETVAQNAAWSQFVETLVNPVSVQKQIGTPNGEAGFPEDELSDDEIDWSPIIGSRVRVSQVIDEYYKGKKRKDKTRVDANGKPVEYDYTRPVVTAFYGKEAPAKVVKSKTAAKAAPAKAGKTAKPKADDVSGPASEALLRYLGSADDNTLPKTKIRMKVLTDKTFANQPDLKNNVMSWLAKDENLESVEGVAVDGSDVALAA